MARDLKLKYQYTINILIDHEYSYSFIALQKKIGQLNYSNMQITVLTGHLTFIYITKTNAFCIHSLFM